MLRWFAKNDIATNFLMLAILIGGGLTAYYKVPLEVSPTRELPMIWINVPFRGATPDDVERIIAKPIEAALEGTAGIEEIVSECNSGRARIRVNVADGYDTRTLRDEIEPLITSLPSLRGNDAIEPPELRIPDTASWKEVITVAVTGDVGEKGLITAANAVRDDLVALPGISQVEVKGTRNFEISIEIDQESLRDYGLTLSQLTSAIRSNSVDVPAGSINTGRGSLMLRTKGQAFTREEFEAIPISAADGARITLGDVAQVNDGFEQEGKIVRFNGEPALLVEILRSQQESAIRIADTAREYVAAENTRLPDGMELYIWDDESIPLRGRLSTLAWSLAQGALLVFLVLGLFLRPMLAFWVVIGIPVSFAGGVLLMPFFGVSANMMSIFGFIIVLGIVVDDAIVTGESIFSKLRAGLPPLDAAVTGAKEVSTPVTFGILTTIVAFIPLLYVDGRIGHFAKQIPPIIAPVLIFSLVESKLILPAHLKHLKMGRTKLGFFARLQRSVAMGLEKFVEKVYQPLLDTALRHRLTTLCVFLAMGLSCVGLINGGHLGFVTTPTVERFNISARLRMAQDTPFERTDEVVKHLVEQAQVVQEEFRDAGTGESLITNILSSTGGWPGWGRTNPEFGIVSIEIMPPSQRSERGPRNKEIAARWRELVGDIPDSRRLNIRAEESGGNKEDETETFEIELRGPDSEGKREVVAQLRDLIRSYEGIASVWDSSLRLTQQLQIRLRPEALELGLNQQNLARQVRSSFFGDQAQRVQRDSEAIRVMVRLPEQQRESLHTLDTLQISLPNGELVPFRSVAEVERGLAPANIRRIDGKQTTDIYAQPEDDTVDLLKISQDMKDRIDDIIAPYPELSWRYDGYLAEHEENRTRTLVSAIGLFLALYALLAIPFKSLVQPLFVLAAVPFGVIGALLGHIYMDITPSWLSIFGMLALAGVVVNDSLVMVDFINQKRAKGVSLFEAVSSVGASRFRPILLTTLTTFMGLLPLLSDNSIQAQFLIPMAVSLAFGIVFATAITLFLIPTLYLIAEDIRHGLGRAKDWYLRPFRRE